MRRLHGPLLAALFGVLPCALLHAQAPAPAKPKPLYPMEADLFHGLNAGKLEAGGTVQVKLLKDWTDNRCTLKRNAVVTGDVVKLDIEGETRKSLAIQFRYACEGVPPQRLTWLALLAPEQYGPLDSNGNPVTKQAIRSSSFGEGDPLRPSGVKNGTDMSGRQNPALPLFVDGSGNDNGLRPTAVKTGEVWRLPKLTLSVGSGPDGSTVLASTEKYVKVPGHSVLILVLERLALLPVAAAPLPVVGPAAGAASTSAAAPTPAATPAVSPMAPKSEKASTTIPEHLIR